MSTNIKQVWPLAVIAHVGFWVPLLLGFPIEFALMSTGGFWLFFWTVILFVPAIDPEGVQKP